jgi:formylglycine-generating enzyme required for sulfatase activity
MHPAPEDRLLGEYRLKELVSENPLTRTWLAEQISVSRRVLVDELRAEQMDQRDGFLANVRAKAAVEHPLIGSVYEAVAEPGLCFFAHELLTGSTLEDRRKAGEPFKPGRLAHVLRRIAEAHLYHESIGQTTLPFGLEHVHIDSHGVIRLDNLALAGAREPGQAEIDIDHLGQALQVLVADGQAGSSRLLTLLAWMRGEGLEAPITWEQVCDVCTQIEQQLADPNASATPTQAAALPRKKLPVALIMSLAGFSLMVLLAFYLFLRPKPAPAPPRPRLPEPVLIAAGKHPTPDGTEEPLKAFQISAHEVTIGQYAEFLEILDTLAKDQRERTFDHESQPATKTSHLPDDWAALLAAAKLNGTWNTRPVTLDCPVVGVDWWDAAAYAEWKQVRLPTQEEWFAALRVKLDKPMSLSPAAWIPVTTETPDRTPLGLIGMAGSVCEWTRRPATNPANPLGERKWVLIGGSFLKPGTNALTREWIDERSLRRPDLGFRIVSDAK